MVRYTLNSPADMLNDSATYRSFDPQKSLEEDVTSKNTKSALFYLQM